jgi:hypothetical protein
VRSAIRRIKTKGSSNGNGKDSGNSNRKDNRKNSSNGNRNDNSNRKNSRNNKRKCGPILIQGGFAYVSSPRNKGPSLSP